MNIGIEWNILDNDGETEETEELTIEELMLTVNF